MSKTREERNREKIQKIKDTGSKQVSILLSKEEFEELIRFMKLHKISSYRELINFVTTYKLIQINDVQEIPINQKSASGFDTFIKDGKKYELLGSIVYGTMNRNIETGELFPF